MFGHSYEGSVDIAPSVRPKTVKPKLTRLRTGPFEQFSPPSRRREEQLMERSRMPAIHCLIRKMPCRASGTTPEGIRKDGPRRKGWVVGESCCICKTLC